MNKLTEDGNLPATKEDISRLDEDLELMGGNLAFQIDEVRQEQLKQGEEQAKQSRILGDILSVNQAILGQLAGMQGHGDSIENHEERITGLEVKVRILQK